MSRLAALILMTLTAAAALGRTVELTCWDLTGAAMISPEAPRLSWTGHGTPLTAKVQGFYSAGALDLLPIRTLLARFDLSKIPHGVRITSAEWVLPITYQPYREMQFCVYRVGADWGAGVCHEYRMLRPQKLTWQEPGARGIGADRALSPTAKVELTKSESEVRINVTSDVELWHSGAAPNHGWMVRVEREGVYLRFASPMWTGRENWKLRVTYEPQ